MKHQRLSVVRLALSVSPIAAWRLAPKEDFTPNAQRKTVSCAAGGASAPWTTGL